MPIMRLTEEDFGLFLIDGFEERMAALKTTLRPKLVALGNHFSPELSMITGQEMYPHVAKHARRKTNPPNDSWVAFSANPRGYKMMPHFQLTFWHSHLLIQWGMIYEAKNKREFSEQFTSHLHNIRENIPGDYHLFKDHMKPEGAPLNGLTDEEALAYAKRLNEIKKGELMIGKVIPKSEAVRMEPHVFHETVKTTWENLNYFHRLT